MNVNKIQLKALVLNALMLSLVQQNKQATVAQTTAVLGFNDELEAAGAFADPEMNVTIDDRWESLLAAIDTLPNTQSEGL